MFNSLKRHIIIALLLILFVSNAVSQKGPEGESNVSLDKCRSICVYLENQDQGRSVQRSSFGNDMKVNAVLVNNTRWGLKVQASGEDELFYDVMSDINSIKQHYECHVCYTKVIKPKSKARFVVYADDLKDMYAIRVRFNFAWEQANSDNLLHYVSWIKGE